MELPKKLLNIVDEFSKIPGIGEKTALRHVLTISNWENKDIFNFGHAMNELTKLKRCQNCGLYADEDTCKICLSGERKQEKLICVVESATDCLAIERSNEFKGTYHILNGVLNPLLGVGPDELNISKLVSRIHSEEVETILLAINPSVEGDATCSYIKQVVGEKVLVERIGFGMPMGGSLEYLDSLTITKAMENRTILD